MCVRRVCDCVRVIHLFIVLKLKQQVFRGFDLAAQETQALVLLMCFKTFLDNLLVRSDGRARCPHASKSYIHFCPEARFILLLAETFLAGGFYIRPDREGLFRMETLFSLKVQERHVAHARATFYFGICGHE